MKVKVVANGGMLKKATKGSAGYDLFWKPGPSPIVIPPGGRQIIPTGIYLEIPPGYEAQVRSRSGLAAKYGVTVLNAPGTIDSDYRSEVGVILYNSSNTDFRVPICSAIAQLVFAKVETPKLILVAKPEDFSDTERGSGGFGSTDKDSK